MKRPSAGKTNRYSQQRPTRWCTVEKHVHGQELVRSSAVSLCEARESRQPGVPVKDVTHAHFGFIHAGWTEEASV